MINSFICGDEEILDGPLNLIHQHGYSYGLSFSFLNFLSGKIYVFAYFPMSN